MKAKQMREAGRIPSRSRLKHFTKHLFMLKLGRNMSDLLSLNPISTQLLIAFLCAIYASGLPRSDQCLPKQDFVRTGPSSLSMQ